ncbi:uncharacterized protein LOC110393069 [Numida meleagris]|uniref:uncharacterized protein LOC110393069 n=1 Tax=Numida meleagris TaxID=8996 RepID=UPI000B3DF61E|nr:uncharacterized protein LOC110393069 [Numida meleagris]
MLPLSATAAKRSKQPRAHLEGLGRGGGDQPARARTVQGRPSRGCGARGGVHSVGAPRGANRSGRETGPSRAEPNRAVTRRAEPDRAEPSRAGPCSTALMTSRSHVGERRGGAGDWLAAAQRHFKAGEGATIVVEWAELSIVLHTSKKTLPLIYQYKKDPLRGGHFCVMATSLLGLPGQKDPQRIRGTRGRAGAAGGRMAVAVQLGA